MVAFENWLQALFDSPAGEKVMLLSRLGILEHHLSRAQVYFQLQLTHQEENVKRLEQEALEDLRARQAKFNQNISEASLNLVRLRAELSQLADTLLSGSVSQAKALIGSNDPKWVSLVQELIRNTCTVCATQGKRI